MILQVGQPTDMVLADPPCLRHIDTRIQDGKLHFFPYFRSWDLYGGFPANLAAIEMMKQYCAEAIGVENVEIIATSKGLHSMWNVLSVFQNRVKFLVIAIIINQICQDRMKQYNFTS